MTPNMVNTAGVNTPWNVPNFLPLGLSFIFLLEVSVASIFDRSFVANSFFFAMFLNEAIFQRYKKNNHLDRKTSINQ